MHYLISLKFGTLKVGIRMHPDTKFGKWSLSYKRLFAKNNTKPTAFTANGKKLKIGKETG